VSIQRCRYIKKNGAFDRTIPRCYFKESFGEATPFSEFPNFYE